MGYPGVMEVFDPRLKLESRSVRDEDTGREREPLRGFLHTLPGALLRDEEEAATVQFRSRVPHAEGPGADVTVSILPHWDVGNPRGRSGHGPGLGESSRWRVGPRGRRKNQDFGVRPL